MLIMGSTITNKIFYIRNCDEIALTLYMIARKTAATLTIIAQILNLCEFIMRWVSGGR